MDRKIYLQKDLPKTNIPKTNWKNPLKYLPKNLQNCIKKHLEGFQKSSKNGPQNPQQKITKLPKKNPNTVPASSALYDYWCYRSHH